MESSRNMYDRGCTSATGSAGWGTRPLPDNAGIAVHQAFRSMKRQEDMNPLFSRMSGYFARDL